MIFKQGRSQVLKLEGASIYKRRHDTSNIFEKKAVNLHWLPNNYDTLFMITLFPLLKKVIVLCIGI